MADSRLERVRNLICDGLAGINDTAYPGTSTTPYRTNVKKVYRGLVGGQIPESETPCLAVDYSYFEVDINPEHRTDNFEVFDLLSLYHICGVYAGATQSIPGIVFSPMETLGHPLMHDCMRWLLWNSVTYRNNSDPDNRWMIDHRGFKMKVNAYDKDLNAGKFQIDFTVRVNNTTRDLL